MWFGLISHAMILSLLGIDDLSTTIQYTYILVNLTLNAFHNALSTKSLSVRLCLSNILLKNYVKLKRLLHFYIPRNIFLGFFSKYSVGFYI